MPSAPERIYRVSVDVPPAYLDRLMDAIDAAMTPVYPGYRRSFTYYPVTGTWISLPGSHPFDGRTSDISKSAEIRLEFVVKETELTAVLRAIDTAHPYEEPVVDVTRELAWRSLLTDPSP